MARSLTAHAIDAELKRTFRAQAEAADPAASVWVSANAGTGKTHVLTMRVLRLMLAGTAPEQILCLTYTKAAAAEMAKRVFETLAKWVTASDADLTTRLGDLLGRAPAKEECAHARTLFTAAIETPGGLKVQTIHAFAERLLQRFPLEAGVAPSFTILDDATARTLRREAIDAVLTAACRDEASPLGRALQAAVAYAVDDRFDDILADALEHRDWLDAALRLPSGTAKGPAGLDAAELLFRKHFGVRAKGTRDVIAGEITGLFRDGDLAHLHAILSGGAKTDVGMAAKIAAALAAPTPARQADELSGLFFKSDGEPREKFLTKSLKEAHPEIEPMLTRTQGQFITLHAEMKGAGCVAATMALHHLANAVLQRYREAKSRRAALDFDDLIERTRNLLLTANSAEWVLFKLDSGIAHILVDESQDTSPNQWRIVEALAGEFYSGAAAREEQRTLFAVGDEKQSIYSFQGAAPEMFARMGDGFEKASGNAGMAWRRIPLHVSFRSAEPVLDAVDRVFADAERTRGVESVPHVAKRFGQAGLVEIWPTETYAEPPRANAWSPLAEEPAPAPVARLANRIAGTIKDWLANGEMLASENRPVRAGDILILVRKRNPFAGPMVAALKTHGIQVAGADRIRLTEQIAVQDLQSLGGFLTLPEDDLSLAEVLKSPIFDLDDDDLLAIAYGRKGTLWKALLDSAASKPAYRDAAETLKRWRKAADFTPPFEFFASLLDKDGVRNKLLARLGLDAADPIDEFLNLALTYDDGAPPSLAGFLHWLAEANLEIKRDMEHGRDEVRVMTVHGAKGLEAPIVFLPDTCTTGSGGAAKGGPIELADMPRPDGCPVPFVWPVKGTSKLAPIAAARATIDRRDSEERNRLLYVAMTRARDRLYIAGFDGKNGPAPGCWYNLVTESLDGALVTAETAAGQSVRRLASSQTAPPEPPKTELSDAHVAVALPPWAAHYAPREPQLAVPLAPSRLAPYETDETGEPLPAPAPRDKFAEPPSLTPAALADESRFLRGTLTHALLEHLPSLDAALWPKAAKAFIEKRGTVLSARAKSSIVSEVLSVLTDKTFAPLFGPQSRAEVPIVAEIARPRGRGPVLRLTGQIDRLAELGNDVLIVDYKTNRAPPVTPDDVADVYLYQLAAYRLALTAIFPGKAVRAAILWTGGPRIMEIPSSLLDKFAVRLWDIDPARLDA